jgi:hypothetical protein
VTPVPVVDGAEDLERGCRNIVSPVHLLHVTSATSSGRALWAFVSRTRPVLTGSIGALPYRLVAFWPTLVI